MKRRGLGKAAARRRVERATEASEELGAILAEAVDKITRHVVTEFQERAMAAARGAALVAAGEPELPTPAVALGVDAPAMPIALEGLITEEMWAAYLAEASEFFTLFLIEEYGELGIQVVAEQPLVDEIVVERITAIEDWTVEFRQSILRVVREGFENARSVRDVAKAIEDAGLAGARRATLISRTELVGGANAATHRAAAMAAEPGDRRRWVSAHDERVRRTHREADGQEVAWDEPFTVGNSKMMHPGDRSLGAAVKELAMCRCTWLWIQGDDDPESPVTLPAE